MRGKSTNANGTGQGRFGARVAIAAMVWLVLMAVSWLLYDNWQQAMAAEAKQRVHTRLLAIQENLVLSLAKVEMFATTFGLRVEERLESGEEVALKQLTVYVDYLEREIPAFLFASLSRQYMTVEQFPLGKGEALGFDLTLFPAFDRHITKAVDEKLIIVDGPLGSVDGIHRLVARYPLFKGQQFWGLVSLHFDFERFIAQFGIDGMSSAYRYAIDFFHEGGSERLTVGAPLDENQDMVFVDGTFSAMRWRVRAQPVDRWASFLFLECLYIGLGVLFSLAMATLIYMWVREYHRMQERSLTDPLTGLYSRHGFDHYLAQEVKAKNPFVLALLDIDNFKAINDTWGHDGGDQALVAFARLLRSAVQSEDTVARYGGDEFAIIMRSCDSDGCVSRLFDRICGVHISISGSSVPIFVSLGASSAAAYDYDQERLKEAVDQNLYRSKRSGKNQYSFG